MSFFNRKRKKTIDSGIKNIIDPILEWDQINEEQQQELKSFIQEFIQFLRKLCELEASAHVRSHNLEKEKQAEGYSDFAQTDDIKDLWKSYHKAFYELCAPYCTQELLNRGYGETFGVPERFHYVNNGCRLVISKIDNSSLVIEAFDFTQLQQHDKFIFNKIEERWLLNELYFTYPNSDRWFIDLI